MNLVFLAGLVLTSSTVKGSLPNPENPCLDGDCDQPDYLGTTREFTLGYIRQICNDLHDDIKPVKPGVNRIERRKSLNYPLYDRLCLF